MEVKKGFKQTEIGSIPNEWSLNRLQDVTKDMIQGVNTAIDIPEYVSDGIPMLKANNVIDMSVIFQDCEYISEATFKRYSDRYKLRKNDFLFSNIGARLGTGSLLNVELDCSFAWNVLRIIPNQTKINPQFLAHTINSPKISQIIKSQQAGSGMGFVPKGTMQEILVPVPPKMEQEAIANALSDADAYIESLEKLIAKKRLIKKGVMQELLSGKRRLEGFKDKWKIISLGDFGFTFGGLTGKGKADFGNGNADYVTFLNVINNVVIDHSIHEKFKLDEGENQNEVRENDLLFNGSSETPEEVAFCSCVKGKVKKLYLNSFCFGFRPTTNGLSSEYMSYFFRSIPGRELVKSLAQGATRYNISKTALLKARFEIPSLEEQKAIADIFMTMDKDIFILQQKLQKARLIKQGMMQELLTGRIRLV